MSPLVTETTNNFIYKSAHLVPLSANLCAFFVKHFHVFKMPVECLEFSIHFYVAFSIDKTFLTLSGGKKNRKKMVFVLYRAISFTLLWFQFAGRKEIVVTIRSFVCCPIHVQRELFACCRQISPLDIHFLAINRIQSEL